MTLPADSCSGEWANRIWATSACRSTSSITVEA
jgi:hypothetical protein